MNEVLWAGGSFIAVGLLGFLLAWTRKMSKISEEKTARTDLLRANPHLAVCCTLVESLCETRDHYAGEVSDLAMDLNALIGDAVREAERSGLMALNDAHRSRLNSLRDRAEEIRGMRIVEGSSPSGD